MEVFKCDICWKNHATFEHRIYEKLRLVKSGVPIENLFVMSDETSGDEKTDERLKKIREAVDNST